MEFGFVGGYEKRVGGLRMVDRFGKRLLGGSMVDD